ncbi:MAG: response regulator [Gammaproteobacteria bacterium]|nr:response regulator [Gammaproteobacteria bacterium]
MTVAKRLLLVDDDGVALATFGKGLKDTGYEVVLADSGEMALEQVAEGPPPDLAILDIRMEGMSGIEVAGELRQLGISSIFLSAFDDDEYVRQALEKGALGYLVKPINVDKAIPTIEAALKSSQDLNVLKETEKRLDGALENSNTINVVVGILMERHRLGKQEAFELLRKKARSKQRKVTDLAGEVLVAWETFSQLKVD